MVRGIRGAATAEENTREAIFDAVKELMSGIVSKNGLDRKDIISVVFTVSPDLTAAFPAAGVREMGYDDIPLLDMAAPPIDGGLPKCIRALVYVNTELSNGDIHHVYLGGARELRPDLCEK